MLTNFILNDFQTLTPLIKASQVDRFKILIDVNESQDHYEILATLPGLSKESTQLHIQDHILTITYERVEEKNEHVKAHITERFRGKASRSLELPRDACEEDISATFEEGTLKIKIGKKVPEQRSIMIQ
jgi:HSP20 family protein